MLDTRKSAKVKASAFGWWIVETAPLPLILLFVFSILGVLLYLFLGPVHAHPAEDPNAAWYQSLRTAAGTTCCSLADCKETDYRITRAGDVEALTEAGDWVEVPPDKILKRTENPTGYAVMCYTPSFGVLCFVLPAGA